MPATPRRPRKQAKPVENAPVTLRGSVEATQGETATTGSGEHIETQAVHRADDREQTLREIEILDALARGETYREIATTYKISIATLSKIAQRRAVLESGAIANLMQSEALTALEAWKTAMATGAAAGKHAAARDWLTHSKALEPVGNEASGGAKVAIVIGMPGSPVGVDSPQVITVQQVSSKD